MVLAEAGVAWRSVESVKGKVCNSARECNSPRRKKERYKEDEDDKNTATSSLTHIYTA